MYCLGRCIHNNKPIAIGTWNALWKNLRMEQFARAIGNDSCTQSHHHHHFRCSDHEVSLITLPARNLHRETEQAININMLHLKNKCLCEQSFYIGKRKAKLKLAVRPSSTHKQMLFFLKNTQKTRHVPLNINIVLNGIASSLIVYVLPKSHSIWKTKHYQHSRLDFRRKNADKEVVDN